MTCEEPGCANPVAAVSKPTLHRIWHNCTAPSVGQGTEGSPTQCKIVVELRFDAILHSQYGAPTEVYLELGLIPAEKAVSVAVTWFNKSTTRLPESMMMSFRPTAFTDTKTKNGAEGPASRQFQWELDILGEWTSPYSVGRGTTNQWQHAVWSGARYVNQSQERHGLLIESSDAPLACPIVDGSPLLGGSTPVGEGLDQSPHHPHSITGIAFNLYNNMMPISGFNQWFPFGTGPFFQQNDTASLFRFTIREKK